MGYAVYDTTQWNGQTDRYGTMAGTSMSSPVMAGIIALWMQHNPSLGTDAVRAIVCGTARNDRFTGPVADNPDNIWGHGKVNAYGGLPTTTTMWLVNTFSEEDGYGTVTGGGVVTEGVHTLTAVPGSMYQFVQWDDGITTSLAWQRRCRWMLLSLSQTLPFRCLPTWQTNTRYLLTDCSSPYGVPRDTPCSSST